MRKNNNEDRLRDMIMSDTPDLIKGKYVMDKKAFDDYVKAQEKLAAMQAKGKLIITEVDEEDKPYYLHCIYITPVWDDCDDFEIATRELAGVLRLMDKMIVSKGDDTIQLSKKIYEENKSDN